MQLFDSDRFEALNQSHLQHNAMGLSGDLKPIDIEEIFNVLASQREITIIDILGPLPDVAIETVFSFLQQKTTPIRSIKLRPEALGATSQRIAELKGTLPDGVQIDLSSLNTEQRDEFLLALTL